VPVLSTGTALADGPDPLMVAAILRAPAVSRIQTNESTCALRLENVSYSYGDVLAVDRLSLEVRGGTVAGLIGPNGSGKSTTLRLATGLLPAAAGAASVFGHDLASDPIAAKVSFAYVPDTPTGFEHLSVDEYLELYATLQRADDAYLARATTLLEAMQLLPYRDRLLGALSTGTRRKLSIAAAEALVRPLLIIDEATSALDPEAVIVLESLLRFRAGRGRATLIATQDLDFAERNCGAVTLLASGKLVAEGSPERLRAEFDTRSLRDVFVRATGLGDVLRKLDESLDRPLAE
jgi:ABC-2 type transport system ATP-binding protein